MVLMSASHDSSSSSFVPNVREAAAQQENFLHDICREAMHQVCLLRPASICTLNFHIIGMDNSIVVS